MADFKGFMKGLKDDKKLMDALNRALTQADVGYQKAVLDQLDQILTDLSVVDGLVRPTSVNREVLSTIDRRVYDILEGEGLENFITELDDVMMRRLSTLDRLIKAGKIDGAAGIDFQNLDVIESRLREKFSDIGSASEYAAKQLRDEVLSYKLDMDGGSSVKFSQLRDSLITKAGILPRYAGTVANTTLYSTTRFARTMQAKKAGIKKMKYMGVMDNLTRPFCARHIGMVQTVEFWEQHTNDVSPNPVSEYGGGWNCRHFLVMWADEFETAYNKSHPPKKKPPTKPNAPPPAPEPDPSVPPIIPNEVIEKVDQKFPDSFMKESAILLDAPVDTRFKRNGKSFHMPHGKNYIQLGMSSKYNGKANMRTAVHEYGHAIHHNNKILTPTSRWSSQQTPETRRWYDETEPKIKKLFSDWLGTQKLRSRLKTKTGSNRFLWETLDEEFQYTDKARSNNYGTALREVYGKQKGNDIIDQMGDFIDMLHGATRGKYGTGHEIKYQKIKGEVEVWAHLWELRHLNYDELMNMKAYGIGDLVKELKKISDDYFDRLIKIKT